MSMTSAAADAANAAIDEQKSAERPEEWADEVAGKFAKAREAICEIIFGLPAVVDQVLITLLSGGNGLLIGLPGLAKTRLVDTLGTVLGMDTKRIQFTPDLMPGDIVGSEVLEEAEDGKRSFRFVQGPVFCQLLMADEINRASPRTQSALLQAMQEHHVTVAGDRFDLPRPFHVLATQNPLEQEGTYPLPEAQLDRFLFKYVLDYPSLEDERAIVIRHGHSTSMPNPEALGLTPVATLATLVEIRTFVENARLSDEIVNYVVDVVRSTRAHPSLEFGASPRAANMLASAARSLAVLNGRDFVIPDDVKALAIPALQHRVVLAPGSEIEGISTPQVIRQILEQTAAPR